MSKLFICFFLLIFASKGSIQSQVISATSKDFWGTWIGHDENGVEYNLTLNRDNSMQLTVSGRVMPSIIYKITLEKLVESIGFGHIDFYTKEPKIAAESLSISTQEEEKLTLTNCGIVKYDGKNMILQFDWGINRPSQFNASQLITMTK